MAGCRPPEPPPLSSFPSLPSAPAAAANPASGAALIWPGSGAGSSSVPWPLLPPVQPPAAAAPAGTRGEGAVSPVLGVAASSPRPAPFSPVPSAAAAGAATRSTAALAAAAGAADTALGAGSAAGRALRVLRLCDEVWFGEY